MGKQAIHSTQAPAAIGPYSQAIRAGNTVYLSGQIGLDPATGNLRDGIEAQARQVVRESARGRRSGRRFARRHRQADAAAGRPGRLREGQRHHGRASFKPPYPARATYQVAALPKGARDRVEGVLDTRRRPEESVRRGDAWRQGRRRQQKTARATRSQDKLVAARHRARAGPRAAPAAALRGPHAARVRWPRCEPGQAWQVEGIVVNTEIQYRPRRQLVCLLEDGDGATRSSCCASSTSIRASRRRSPRASACARSAKCATATSGWRWCIRSFQVIAPGTPLPDRLTPVYPTTAGLAQDALRKLVRARARARSRVARRNAAAVDARAATPVGLRRRRALSCTNRRRDRRARRRRSTSARIRPGRGSSSTSCSRSSSRSRCIARARAARRAPRLTGNGLADARSCSRALPFTLTRAQQRVIARDPPRPRARRADAAAAAGRRRQRQDDRRGARRAAGDRVRLPGRVHGADRNPRRAALPQARGLARRLAAATSPGCPAACRRRSARRRSRRSSAARRSSRSARTRCSRTR